MFFSPASFLTDCRSCDTCSHPKCVDRGSGAADTKKGSGTSKGALAGGIIGALAFFSIAIFLFIRHRRKSLLRRNSAQARDVKDIPASAETVLNRPDPIEKRMSDPPPFDQIDFSAPPQRRQINPFDDVNSIQTTHTEGTNAIPIGLVGTADSQRSAQSGSSSGSQGPLRPIRSPELSLHDHQSSERLLPHGQAQAYSMRSGVSARNSYMSGASYSSEFLNEAPMIVTPTRGTVRQVVGVVKAEVIQAGPMTPTTGDPLLPPPPYSRPSAKSPLAATSFGPADVISEDGETTRDPFRDERLSTTTSFSPTSRTTFGRSSPNPESTESDWSTLDTKTPVSRLGDDASRPSSTYTQAGSVIDITSATRVNVGLRTPATVASSHRTTMGRLVSPSADGGAPLQEQQRLALAQAQTDKRRISGSSVVSATADSILESFPFVPPSPISDRPVRSPPVSPLAQHSFTNQNVVVVPPSPHSFASRAGEQASDSDSLPAPPSRQLLGMSTASQLSTASSGLGSFPFQIGSDPATFETPPGYNRRRASLDTLALTSDLSSYPLNFDHDQPTK